MSRPLLADDAEIPALEAPYETAPDAVAEHASAVERAQAAGKRMLMVFGADWCPDARRFASVLSSQTLAAFLDARFEAVLVDVGRYDRNLDLAARYGLAPIAGAPAVIVAEPDGRVVNTGGAYDWRTARSRRPQEIADFLAVYADAPAPQP